MPFMYTLVSLLKNYVLALIWRSVVFITLLKSKAAKKQLDLFMPSKTSGDYLFRKSQSKLSISQWKPTPSSPQICQVLFYIHQASFSSTGHIHFSWTQNLNYYYYLQSLDTPMYFFYQFSTSSSCLASSLSVSLLSYFFSLFLKIHY